MENLFTKDFQYHLPQEKIALHPLQERDMAKLLVYQQGKISHDVFLNIPERLPGNTFLFFNNTKVIPARLHFTKDTGAEIEIFLLNPIQPSVIMAEAMASTTSCRWNCTIGNLKRWSDGLVLTKKTGATILTARLLDREAGIVEFSWSDGKTFAEIIGLTGETPLPPYLRRPAEISDRERYQTIYSKHEGAVAAPTAGLHFTDRVLENLRLKNIDHDFLTLHVSAGTFQPIKSENAVEHTMHQEQIIVARKNIENLLGEDRLIIPVGTTSMRTIESIYWFGVKLLKNNKSTFAISQNDPYELSALNDRQDVLKAIIMRMDELKTDLLIGETSIMIRPGYKFRLCQGLITNFHQPSSTLILLVAAFIGYDWRRVYEEALRCDYRFLSYGDSSLLLP